MFFQPADRLPIPAPGDEFTITYPGRYTIRAQVRAVTKSEPAEGASLLPSMEADRFLDFTGKQRKLLYALAGKGHVPIDDVLKAVYGVSTRDKTEALLKLKDRTNAALSSKRPDLEIRRSGDTLRLQPV
jgi:hypothetical protein